MPYRLLWTLLGVLVLASVLSLPPQAASAQDVCPDVAIVWSRGSGQDTVAASTADRDYDNAEGRIFVSRVAALLPDEFSLEIYELGRDNSDYGIAYSYPAVGLSRWFQAVGIRTDLRGETSWPAEYTGPDGYVASLHTGVNELRTYLFARAEQCPDMVYILGGLSQGAHVISRAISGYSRESLPLTDRKDTLNPEERGLLDRVRDRIAFVALIADPTLYLPLGFELRAYKAPNSLLGFEVGGTTQRVAPVACPPFNEQEPYRRGNPPCQLHSAILRPVEGRDIYLPSDMIDTSRSRIGVWCDTSDVVCTAHARKFFVNSHGEYDTNRAAPGGQTWLEEAAEEAQRAAVRMVNGTSGGESFDAFAWFSNAISNRATLLNEALARLGGLFADESDDEEGLDNTSTPGSQGLFSRAVPNTGISFLPVIVRQINSYIEEYPSLRESVAHVWRESVGGSVGSDVVFVIDSTGSMGSAIDEAKSVASAMGHEIIGAGGRVAVVEYRDTDSTSGFVSRVNLEFTDDADALEGVLQNLHVGGGGDAPEALLSALMLSFDRLQWRDGATKAAVVLTDTTYHSPDPEGWTFRDVVIRSLEIDPVNIYPVVPSGLAPEYASLANETAGAVVPSGDDVASALTNAIETVNTRPVIFFKQQGYAGLLGQAIEFQADAVDPDSEIDHYEWDLDGDSSPDTTTAEPTVSHIYTGHFDGVVQVRAISADGDIGSAVSSVLVSAIVCPSGLNIPQFLDVPETSYAATHIDCIYELEVTKGTTETTYSPRSLVTRSHMAAFVARMYEAVAGEPAPIVDMPYTDIAPDSWARDDIARIYGLDITGGASETTYAPDHLISREAMAAYFAELYEALAGEPAPIVDMPYTDIAPDSWARDDIARTYGLGGRFSSSSTAYVPGRNVTREQIATYLSSFYHLLWR